MAGSSGQDWASYQDWTPSTDGLAFVFVKQTEGLTYVNPRAASQVAHARSKGLVVGHYHYPHMANNPATEADRFLTVAKPQPGDLLCLDWEGYDASNKGVSWSRQVAYKTAFLARLKSVAGAHQHVVYANGSYLDRDPKGTYGDALWIATASKPAGSPGIGHPWLFHQYSTAGGIDHDYCSLTAAQLHAWAHAKEPQENEMELGDKFTIPKSDYNPKDETATVAQWIGYGNQKAGAALAAANKANTTLSTVTQQLNTLALKTGTATLTDDQVAQVAERLATNTTFVNALATALGKDLAARMQQ